MVTSTSLTTSAWMVGYGCGCHMVWCDMLWHCMVFCGKARSGQVMTGNFRPRVRHEAKASGERHDRIMDGLVWCDLI